MRRCLSPRSLVVSVMVATLAPTVARSAVRVVTYNVDADTDRNGDKSIDATDATYSTSSVAAVLEAIGGYTLAGNKQAPDVIALQELYFTPSTTLSSIVSKLNAFYGGSATYAYDPTVGATTGTSTGNGPNGLIYNANTIAVSAVTQVGTPDGSGEARAPLRYTLTSLAAPTNNTFYLYDEHTKASYGAANSLRRTYEMDAVRADADKLGSAAHVLYTGDFNLAGTATSSNDPTGSGSAEQGYIDLTAANGTTLATNGNPNSSASKLVAGVARALDPQTSTFTDYSDASAKYYTESDTSLTARFDLQLVTANTLANSTVPGLRLVNQSEVAFGNSYYTAGGTLASLNASGNAITDRNVAATTGYSTATLNALLAATDHLPVVADYVVVVPEPATLGALLTFAVAIVRRRR